MGSRLKIMKLLLQDGTLEGLLTIEDSSWNNGTFLSCPRENIANLLSQDEVIDMVFFSYCLTQKFMLANQLN